MYPASQAQKEMGKYLGFRSNQPTTRRFVQHQMTVPPSIYTGFRQLEIIIITPILQSDKENVISICCISGKFRAVLLPLALIPVKHHDSMVRAIQDMQPKATLHEVVDIYVI